MRMKASIPRSKYKKRFPPHIIIHRTPSIHHPLPLFPQSTTMYAYRPIIYLLFLVVPAFGNPLPTTTSYAPPPGGWEAVDWASVFSNNPSITFASPPDGYPTPTGGYATPSGGYPAPAEYATPAGGFPTPSGGFPTPSGGYPPPADGIYPPPADGVYPPPADGIYPPPPGGF